VLFEKKFDFVENFEENLAPLNSFHILFLVPPLFFFFFFFFFFISFFFFFFFLIFLICDYCCCCFVVVLLVVSFRCCFVGVERLIREEMVEKNSALLRSPLFF
jgi:hypothetical protein